MGHFPRSWQCSAVEFGAHLDGFKMCWVVGSAMKWFTFNRGLFQHNATFQQYVFVYWPNGSFYNFLFK